MGAAPCAGRAGLGPERVVRRLVRVLLDDPGELAIGDRERERLVLVEGLVAPTTAVTVRRDDRVVAFRLRALEVGRERAVAELEQLAVVPEDGVDPLVLAGDLAVARRHMHGIGG